MTSSSANRLLWRFLRDIGVGQEKVRGVGREKAKWVRYMEMNGGSKFIGEVFRARDSEDIVQGGKRNKLNY